MNVKGCLRPLFFHSVYIRKPPQGFLQRVLFFGKMKPDVPVFILFEKA